MQMRSRGAEAAQLLAEEVSGGGFGVDLVFEILGSHFHELVGVAGVAVFAGELAAAVGIDGPLEGHVGLDAIEDGAGGKLEILDGALGFEKVAVRCQASDAD